MSIRKIIVALTLLAAASFTALQAEPKLDISGKIYSQYRWTNGTGTDFWKTDQFGAYKCGPTSFPAYGREDKKYANFMRTEVELELNATVSKYVKAYARIKSIFNSDESEGMGKATSASWSNDWNNGIDDGDGGGGFLKVRGFLISVNPHINYINSIEMGTPMGLPFNKWFLADRRYIDRDNVKGVIVRGDAGDMVKWNLARMWNATYMGPAWDGLNDFQSEDGTYALNVEMTPVEDMLTLDLNAMYYTDSNLDPDDYAASENVHGAISDDGHINAEDDYKHFGTSLDAKLSVSDDITVEAMGMYTNQTYADRMDANGNNLTDALEWVNHNTPSSWWGTNEPYADVDTYSGIFTVTTSDPFEVGFSPKLQVFYIDDNLYTPFGSRREHDMLMMHGGINPIRYTDKDYDREGARQHQSLNTFLYGGGQSAVNEGMTDNNFMRLGEDFYESAIGYYGGTVDFDFELGDVLLNAQANYIMATDNTDGDLDKKDSNYDGAKYTGAISVNGNHQINTWYYMQARDFKGMVGNLSAETKVGGFDLGLAGRYGLWEDVQTKYLSEDFINAEEGSTASAVVRADGTYDVKMEAMVIAPSIAKQLTNSVKFDFYPQYQQVKYTESSTGEELESTITDIVIREKITYDFGGYSFWLRGEHFVRNFDDDNRDDDLNWSTVQLAFEVKF